MSEVDWESVRHLAAMLTALCTIAALCAVVAAAVCVLIWRSARSGDMGTKIDAGDRAVKEHADRALGQIRESLDDVRDAVARIEVHQESEEKHVLRPRDLGAIHDRVNRVAEELAATRAQSTAENKMLSEQLRILQNLVQQQSYTNRNYRT